MSRHAPDQTLLTKAETLIEALPYIQRYAGQTFVIKYGGHAMGDADAAENFAEDIVLLQAVGIKPVVVHGGGPQIGRMLKQLGIESQFHNGLRVTDKETARVAEMVLSGAINKEIVGWIAAEGGKAVGIERHVDLGFVGDPKHVDPTLLNTLADNGLIPVIAPIAPGPDGETYNINADTMAGAIAAKLGASRLFLLTDVAGVLSKDGDLLTDLTPDKIKALKEDGTATGGMIPKLDTCIEAVNGGAEAAVILDGRVPHAMLLEIFTARGAGTLVHR